MSINPFKIKIKEEKLTDLKKRLLNTRWTDEISDSNWSYGADLNYLKELINYWANSYNWRAEEETINSFPNFKANIDGFNIHYIHQRGKSSNPLPLIITHGWPGSFLEMLKIIPMLTDPEKYGGDPNDAFDVIVPSMPGYGFSDKPTQQGFDRFRIAELWIKLMKELGYENFYAQGGDIGAGISVVLGKLYPQNVKAIHLNYIPAYVDEPGVDYSSTEKEFLDKTNTWYTEEGGYWYIQRTRPQTLAYGLNDSPAGLAAWLIEKYRGWADCKGDPENRFTKDEMLANITLYWLTETINSSTRLYYESRKNPFVLTKEDKVNIPCGIIRFAKEEPFPPRELVERSYNVLHWTDVDKGGHFAALEEPKILVEDIRNFFRRLR